MYTQVSAGINTYLQICVGNFLYVYIPERMLNTMLHFMYYLSPDGLVVHSVICAPEDGCSSSRRIKAFLLWFFSLFESFFYAQTRRLHHKMPQLFMQGKKRLYKQIQADTCIYLHMITKYMQIPTSCMHVHVQVLHVWAGMSLCACIACYCRYCMCEQVRQYMHVLHAYAGIVCMCRYCMCEQVLHVSAGVAGMTHVKVLHVNACISCTWRYVTMCRHCMYLQYLRIVT
jgi:hypothetical protein